MVRISATQLGEALEWSVHYVLLLEQGIRTIHLGLSNCLSREPRWQSSSDAPWQNQALKRFEVCAFAADVGATSSHLEIGQQQKFASAMWQRIKGSSWCQDKHHFQNSKQALDITDIVFFTNIFWLLPLIQLKSSQRSAVLNDQTGRFEST